MQKKKNNIPIKLVKKVIGKIQLAYKVAALQQKRTLAFMNHFVLTIVQFLNTFVRKCEIKLQAFENKIQKVEASLIILETKLSSVPELEVDKKNGDLLSEAQVAEPSNTSESHETETIEVVHNTQETHANEIRPEYERFVKMVQVGVPTDAVKLKITMEGLDPNYLDLCLHK